MIGGCTWRCRSAVMALTLGAGAAVAQPSVTLYGVVDTAIEHVNRIGTGRGSVTRMPGITGSTPSRWGLRGVEDLGGGLRAVFQLEGGFAVNNGKVTQGGRLFGRQSWVGLAGSWGELSVGRQFTMSAWATMFADVLGPTLYGTSNLDMVLANPRADNSVAYRGKLGRVTVGGSYSFGRDGVNDGPSFSGQNCPGGFSADRRACKQWTAMLAYDGEGWNVSTAYDVLRGGPGAFAGLTSSALRDRRFMLTGYFLSDGTKVGAGYLRRDNDVSRTQPRSQLWWLGLTHDVTPALTLGAQVTWLDYRHSPDRTLLLSVLARYSLSRRTALYVTSGYIDNAGQLTTSVSSGAPGSGTAPGGHQLGMAVGIRHLF